MPVSVRQSLDSGILVGGHQAVVGFLDCLELDLCLLLIIGVLVRMPNLGQVSVSFLCLCLGSTCIGILSGQIHDRAGCRRQASIQNNSPMGMPRLS